ncbi:MAG: hypothetical protein QOJ86_4503, partial [Bradyrhizobium sp.]|nr:hypothetical protein [Bradyrhizobium sp.]
MACPLITHLGHLAAWRIGSSRRASTTLALPLAARAQQSMPVIGLLHGTVSPSTVAFLAAFRQGLADSGFVEGRNLAIVYRSAESELSRLPALAAELTRIPVAAIAAVGGDSSVRAAKAATSTIPIVFTTAADPVESGTVASLNRPGGNVTGVWFLGSLIAAKQIGLLHDVVPKLATVGLLTAPIVPSVDSVTRDVEAVARTLGI